MFKRKSMDARFLWQPNWLSHAKATKGISRCVRAPKISKSQILFEDEDLPH